jgi:3-isopropylmalate/(R)-2-methylmalate dehydratase large subunit
MGKTLAEKILSKKYKRDIRAGELIVCEPDLICIPDIAGASIIKNVQAHGLDCFVHPEKVIMGCDIAPTPVTNIANDHKFIGSFCRKYGVKFYDEGEGICQELALEGHVRPGDVVIGADSHMTSGGGLGAFATGLGITDIAFALCSGKTWFKVPESIKVVCEGKFPKGVYAKDLVLYLIGVITSEGATYKALEFCGSAVDNMSMAGRLTMACMAVEAGAKVGLFPSDHITRAYLEAHSRGNSFIELQPDRDASYERVLCVDVNSLEPMVSKPHYVDNVAPVRELVGTKVDQVFIGTCTNGRLEDLAIVASFFEGHRRHPETRVIIAPASRSAFTQAFEKGYIKTFVESGAMVVPPNCACCLGTHNGLLADGDICVATQNRNFKGRLGNPNAFIYLTSPATAAVSALSGMISDPREHGCST